MPASASAAAVTIEARSTALPPSRRLRFVCPRAGQDADHRDVAFVTRIFIERGVGALEADHERPWAGPRGRILHRDCPIDEARADARIALDEPHVRGRAGEHRTGP